MIGRSALAARLPTQEGLLLDYVHRLEKHRKGRRAVHVHLSGLMPNNRREHHVRIAANTFENLVKKLQGQIFVLSNADLMFIFKEASLDEVEAAIVKLRFLFSDDPLLADEGSSRPGTFASWYVLERDYDKLLGLAQTVAQQEQERRAVEIAKQAQAGGEQRPAAGEQLTPLQLARTEEALAQADLANLMRRQAVSAVVGRAAPQPVFHEIFVSINDLRQTVLPKVNLGGSPWLFQHLTETLDRRVLSLLNKHDDRTLAGDISINLNVATLLSPEFLVFDDNIRAGMRGTIVLELQKIDIFADLGAYLFARDFAHDRGYRICIDGLTHQTLPFVDRERLGADLVKVIWEPDLADPTRAAAFGEAIKRCGPARVILCRCDSRQAIDFGQAHGITLFQGRFVEAILNDEMKRRGPAAARRR
jgi:hypothetical protein